MHLVLLPGLDGTGVLMRPLLAALSLVHPDVLAARLRDVLAVDVTGELVACDVPVLYLRGTRDMVVPSQNLREILRLRPSVEVAEIAAPHLVLQTQPATAAEAIAEFVARNCVGG